MDASIITNKLTKYYAGTTVAALDQLSLQVHAGEVYGYLGANGAGKSTTIRLLMNFLQPTRGSAQIMGLDSVRDSVAIKQHVGYLAGDVALYSKATGRELLNYLSSLQGKRDERHFKALVERFEAELDKPIASLSKGNRQKLGILQAFMHRPDVLILDEPTSGLDPLMQEAFYTSVREATKAGAAVLMSSHNLVEAQTLCDRIGIIKHGKLIREEAIGAHGTLAKTIFKVSLSDAHDLPRLKTAAHLSWLSAVDTKTARVQASGSIRDALQTLSHFDITGLDTEQLSLEDEFLEFYGERK